MIKVLVADDQELIRQSLQIVLNNKDNMKVIGTAANGQEVICCIREEKPDVILMDIRMPKLDGVQCTKIIKENYPDTVIETSMYALDADKNVLGYVIKVLSTEGYSGNIRFLVGFKLDGTINSVALLEIKESAGLGMNAEAVLIPQYKGKPITIFEVTKTGATKENQVDAISGATITTDAINNGVNAAASYFNVMYASQVVVTEGGETNEE